MSESERESEPESRQEPDAGSSSGSSPRLGSWGSTIVAAVGLAAFALILLPSFFAGYVYESIGAVVVVGLAAYSLANRDVLAGLATFVLWLVVGFAFWSPMLQGLVYGLFVENPGGLQWLVVGVALAGVGVLLQAKADEESSPGGLLALVGVTVALVGFFVVGPWVGGMYTKEHLANEVEADAEVVETLPDSNASKSRIAPRAVARNWAKNSLQYPQYGISGGDITYINGTPHWSYALAPNGLVNRFTNHQIGAVYVNQSSMTKDIVVDDGSRFRYGQGMALTSDYRWELARRDYWNSYKDPFVVPHDGSSSIVVPYTEHDWAFRPTPLPQFYSVPSFGGVKVVHEDGEIEDMSPEEAHDSDLLGESQNYYPYSLALFKVRSMAYRHGILNVWFEHRGQLEVAPVPGQGNSQPFTVPTEEGINYFVAAEPWGDADGIYQVWMIDAQTGEMAVRQFPQRSGLRGPRKAVDSVMGTDTISRLNDVEASEPIPVVKNETLYWEVRIVPESSARITYVAFFDARTEEVAIVETTGDVAAFLSEDRTVEDFVGEGDPSGDGEDGEDGGDDGDEGGSGECAFYVNVDEDGDGTVDRSICVPPGGSVSVEQGGNATDTDTTTAPG